MTWWLVLCAVAVQASPLHEAAANDDLASLKALLNASTDLEEVDENGSMR